MPNFDRQYNIGVSKRIQANSYNQSMVNCNPIESISYLYSQPGFRSLQSRFRAQPALAGVGDTSDIHHFSADNHYSNMVHNPTMNITSQVDYNNVAGVGGTNRDYSFSADTHYDNIMAHSTVMQPVQVVNYQNVAGVGGANTDYSFSADTHYDNIMHSSNVCENFEQTGPSTYYNKPEDVKTKVKYEVNGKKLERERNFNLMYI